MTNMRGICLVRFAVALLGLSSVSALSQGGVLELSGAGRVRISQTTITSLGQLPLGSQPFTIEAWINPNSHGDNSITGWGTRGVANENNGFRLLSGGSVRHFFWSNDLDRSTGDLSANTGGPNADGWRHLAISWDGVSQRQWYLDGQPLGAAHTSGLPNVTLNASGLTIGSAQDNSEGFNGWIDEVRIWNTARSASQVNDGYRSASSGTETGLVGYWNFDGQVEDLSAVGHHGTREGDAVIRHGVNAPLRSLVADNGLVAYWDFNNAANVGQARVGAPLKAFGGAAYSTAGEQGGALNLSATAHQFLALQDGAGNEDQNNVPGNLPLGDSSYTLSAWIHPTGSGTSFNGVVGWGSYGTNGHVNAFRTSNATSGLTNYGWGSSYDYAQGTGNLTGQWHHVAAVYDSATSTKRLYLDGNQVGTGMTIPDLAVDAKNFRVGLTYTGQNEYFDGLMDDVAVFNRPLSANLIRSIADGASPMHAPLVSLWRFDNPANLGKDSSVLANDLTRQGDASYSSQGRLGGALSLDGSGDYLDGSVFPHGVPTGNTPYTLAAWIKPDVTGTRGVIGWGNFGTGLAVNALRLNGDNGLSHYWWGADLLASDAQVNALSVNLDDGQWHHLAATFDGITRTLWLDGQFLRSDTPTGHNATATNFRLGATNFTEFFDGLIDEVAVFNLALSPEEIHTIMRGDFTAYGVAFVPEPSALILLSLGGLGLLWLRSRRPRLAVAVVIADDGRRGG
jgi:hypothetical protein